MDADITSHKEFQKVLEVLKGYTDIFSGISESLSASSQITEAIKKAAELNTFPLSDEFIEQMKKLSSPLIKNEQAKGMIPSGGCSLSNYESNFDNFEPLPKRIRIVIDND